MSWKIEELKYHSKPQQQILFSSKANRLALALNETPTKLEPKGSL
jgi:hypothetical protein